MSKIVLALSLIPALVACSHFKMERSAETTSSFQKLAEENEINNAERLLALGRHEDARLQFRNFQGLYPQSSYYQSARLGEAQALEGQSKWSEAVQLDRDVYLKTVKEQPEIAALALYRMAFSYEALGDDEKTIAVLLDAQKMGKFLPAEVAKAEIPARLAALYGRLGRDREAMKYLNQAEKGITQVREEKRELDQKWLAKTYCQMGSVSTNQLSAENFGQAVDGQKMVQVYLVKAMKLNDPIWSKRALDQAKNTYQNLLVVMDAESSDRSVKNDMGGSLIDLIEQAELFKPLKGQPANGFETDFFSYLQDVRKKTENVLYQSKETMSLTEESQKLHSLKRPGRVKVESLLPEEEREKHPAPTPPKIVPTEDPNL